MIEYQAVDSVFVAEDVEDVGSAGVVENRGVAHGAVSAVDGDDFVVCFSYCVVGAKLFCIHLSMLH